MRNSNLRLLLLLCLFILSASTFASITDELEQLRFNSENCVVPEKRPGASALAGGLCIDPESPPRYKLAENRIQSQDIVNYNALPTNFFWGDIHGVNYLTVSRNQHIPQYCGSCWAFGTTSAIGDRIKILRRNVNPEINLAPQVLINCRGGGTCRGGYAAGVYRYMEYNGLPDETCQNYQAKNGECSPNGYCENCTLFKKKAKNECQPVVAPQKHYISEFGSASQDFGAGVAETENANHIQAEIYARGPVACTIYATDKFDAYTGGIFSQFGFWYSANHIISLVGWGEENGVKYWIGRNSWGTYWGEEGFFKIRRANFFQSLGVENGCTFATPIIPDELKPADPLPEDVPYGEYLLKYHAPKGPSANPEEVRTDPQDQDWLNEDEISLISNKPVAEPAGFESYDIRNLSGVSYASVNRNQNNPRHCESSWAQAATSALNDRFALLKGAKFPEVVLSVQVLLNCIKSDNPCNGGSAEAAYAFIKNNTIPDESCSPYEARANECTAIEICKNCWPPGCYAMKKGQYTPYEISDYGKISGADEIMKEVSQNGPVVCKICYSDDFLSYDGGIYTEKGKCNLKGFVVLSGWGKQKRKRYWIARNSWGTYWGEDGGWFRVTKGAGDLGITDECYWAAPMKPVYKYLESTPVSDHIKRELGILKGSSKTQIIF